MHEALPSEFVREEGVFPVIQAGQLEDLSRVCKELKINQWNKEEYEWVRAKRDDEFSQIKWKQVANKKDVIPNVKGMVLRDAFPLLENLGLRVIVKGRGRINAQSLEVGSRLIVGSRIELKLSE